MRASDFLKEDLDVGVRRVLEELRTLAKMEHPILRSNCHTSITKRFFLATTHTMTNTTYSAKSELLARRKRW
jgi:hypothetical protein